MKQSWIKKHPILLAFLLLGGSVGGLNLSGFCIPEGRWLSDEEKIRAAVDSLIIRQDVAINTPDKGTQIYKVIPYENIDSFLDKNPVCCSVGIKRGDDFIPQTFYTRITGKHAENIRIEYVAQYLDETGVMHTKKSVTTPLISNCGKVRFGMWH